MALKPEVGVERERRSRSDPYGTKCTSTFHPRRD